MRLVFHSVFTVMLSSSVLSLSLFWQLVRALQTNPGTASYKGALSKSVTVCLSIHERNTRYCLSTVKHEIIPTNAWINSWTCFEYATLVLNGTNKRSCALGSGQGPGSDYPSLAWKTTGAPEIASSPLYGFITVQLAAGLRQQKTSVMRRCCIFTAWMETKL